MAEALPSLEVALAIDAVAADEGAVLPIRPVPALGFTPGRDEGKRLEHLETSSIPLHARRRGCISPWWLVVSEARRGVEGWTEPTNTAMELEGVCETPAYAPRTLDGSVGLSSQGGMLFCKLLCPGSVPGLQNPSVTLFPQRIREVRHCSPRTQCCTQLHSPVSDPARIAVGAFAIDVIAGVAILAGGTELLAAFSVEAG